MPYAIAKDTAMTSVIALWEIIVGGRSDTMNAYR